MKLLRKVTEKEEGVVRLFHWLTDLTFQDFAEVCTQ